MVEIKKLGVLSVGVMWGILSAIGGLIGGIFMMIMTTTIPVYDEMGFLGWFIGGMAIVAMPIFYGVCGFLGGIISAALYNLFQQWVGGVKIEFKQETDSSQ